MKITVVIPTRNRADLLVDAIESVMRQSLRPQQIIVVDNGSTDTTAEIVRRYAGLVEGMVEPMPGKSRALNAAMTRAVGDAILVLDDDDVLPRDALAAHARALQASPRATYSFGRYQRFRGVPPTRALHDWHHPDIERVPDSDQRRTVIKLMEHCFLPNPAWLARRAALAAAGPYDVDALRSLDYDMILRLARTDNGAFVDDVVLFQRQHSGARPGVRETTGNDDVFAAWDYHDRRIFRKVARTWTPYDFRPFEAMSQEPWVERVCWLQKGVILFAQRCFAEGLEALQTARHRLGADTPVELEIATATRMFLRSFVPDPVGQDHVGLAIASAMQAMDWPQSMRAAFSQGARWQIRRAVKARDLESVLQLSRFLIAAFGPRSAAAGMTRRVPVPWHVAGARGRVAVLG